MSGVRWTPEQAEAILATDDTLLSANAGSGKTTTVIAKILWLLGLDTGGVREDTDEPLPPCPDPCELREIAAITFTEKAAHDLKRKLRKEIEASDRADELRWEIDRASIGTIHSFCASLLREHALRLGIDPTFAILDEREARAAQDDLIRDLVLEALEAGDEGAAALFQAATLRGYENTNGLIDLVRIAMTDLRWHRDRYDSWCAEGGAELDLDRLRDVARSLVDDPGDADGTDDAPDADAEVDPAAAAAAVALDDAVVAHCDTLHRLARTALDAWKGHLGDENVRDYDALILDTRELLTGPQAGAALRSIRDRYRILVIDEFQDTDQAQADIAFAIGRGVPRPQLYFVGDPKQSIYGFRGADIAVWNRVSDELAGDGARLALTRNFRSQPQLIEYLNAVGEAAIEGAGRALEEELPGNRVAYSPLEPGLEAQDTAGVEWLDAPERPAATRRGEEGEQVARRIREMVEGGERIVDPDTGEPRPCGYRDIAILYRSSTGMEHYTRRLARHGVPFFHPAQGGLTERQEIADVVNALKLVDNLADDVAAFGFLRSPFVGLRDEVITRIGLDRGSRSLLWQARAWVAEGTEEDEWVPPEGEDVVAIERRALRDALELLDDLVALAARLPLDELAGLLLDRSGYRLHLMLMGENREALANLQTFLRIAEQHRHLPLGTFLDVWDRWDEQDSGLPQAPLYSADDDVVTVTTIHRAKGLEWPVVFLIDGASRMWSRTWHQYWIDPDHGPILGPRTEERGPRAAAIVERKELEERAEEARLLYVATTRARDRLIVTGPGAKPDTYLDWLAAGLDLDVVRDRSAAESLDPPQAGTAVSLDWLGRLEEASLPALAAARPDPPLRFLTSATELMMRENDPDQWELRYVHGVEPKWVFAREGKGDGVPAHIRGTVIHGALERYPPGPLEEAQHEAELARILDEVVGELDAPELEPYLARGRSYREALEEEVARVVSSDDWRWYTEGEHYRELEFLHLFAERDWRVGAFDLYRIHEPEDWIIDFKTHEVSAEGAESAAEDYRRQAAVYRSASSVRGKASVRLHFTGPGATFDMAE